MPKIDNIENLNIFGVFQIGTHSFHKNESDIRLQKKRMVKPSHPGLAVNLRIGVYNGEMVFNR